jgi:hypothetical protein
LNEVYEVTLVTGGIYNLEVKEEGPMTNFPGKRPGTCESGTDKDHTVAAAITCTTQ